MTISEENARRNVRRTAPRDPLTGLGCDGPRFEHPDPASPGAKLYLPASMATDPDFRSASKSAAELHMLRLRHDFEYWAATCCHIRDKSTGRLIKFILNTPQREVLSCLERDRLAGRPIRLIMLKARQWGGSTLIQMYMAWIQCAVRCNWNSLICAHVKDAAYGIRGMYTTMLESYPAESWHGEEGSRPSFKAFERSAGIREICGRGCRVTIGSSENSEAVRGGDYAMAHLSEVAFWADSDRRSPENFIRAICGAINRSPLTLIVMESTANGVGNYFHSEWERAERGESDKAAVFVPWYKINIYRTELGERDPEDVWKSLDDYERSLWNDYGLTLEQILWYHEKRREYPSQSQMCAEYPTTAREAFVSTGHAVFSHDDLDRLRRECRQPQERGDFDGYIQTGPESLTSLAFYPFSEGRMKIWRRPEPQSPGGRYIVTVDIGGRSWSSDYSVISVFDRIDSDTRLEVVAQWRGHIDHDKLAWKAAAIGRWYGNARLVFESNTLETDNTDGDPAEYILTTLKETYDNLYCRENGKPGFHTNRASKTTMITLLNTAVRDGLIIERDTQAVEEMMTYRYYPNGSQGASPGHHDDILITRAMAFYIQKYDADPCADDIEPLLARNRALSMRRFGMLNKC